MMKAILLSLMMISAAQPAEYEITITGPIKIRVTVVDTTLQPAPDPEPMPPPPPVEKPLPETITVGPGQAYAELHELNTTALQENAVIKLLWRKEPYHSKIGIEKSGVTLQGVPGPEGEKPVISGADAKTHPKYPFGKSLQSVSIVCIGGDGVTVKGILFRDAWEQDRFTSSSGEQLPYVGGAACIRVHDASKVTIEDCEFTEAIHSVFAKGISKRVDNLTIRDCSVTRCGNETGQRDETTYLETFGSILDRVTIKDSRNPGTTCLHSRCNKLTLKDCRFEGGGLLVYTDSVSEKSSPCLVDGRLPDATATLIGGTFLSRSASPFFSMRSDIGPEIAIRDLSVKNATLIGIGGQKTRFRRTIGTPTFDGNKIAYESCTFALLPETPGLPATALEYLDNQSKGTVVIGRGCKEFIYEKNARISGSDGVTPANWRELIEVKMLPYSELETRFLK